MPSHRHGRLCFHDRALARQDLSGADAPAAPLSAHTRHLPRPGESFLERGALR
nr:MAG TPA_asm: hypothetical protein [Caudoviricetes sp.]